MRPDLFHLLREAHCLGQRLERAAYCAIKVARRARRAEREARAAKRRRGRPPEEERQEQAEAKEEKAMAIYDLYTWLIEEVRQTLEPIRPEGSLTSAAQARTTVETAVELLQELGHKEVSALAQKLLAHLEELVAPLSWLEQRLSGWRQGLDAETASFIGWAYLHRQALDVENDFPPALRPAAQVFWEALALFHRASSLAESLHSWLRPYLQIHRGMGRWLLPLLQWFWNQS